MPALTVPVLYLLLHYPYCACSYSTRTVLYLQYPYYTCFYSTRTVLYLQYPYYTCFNSTRTVPALTVPVPIPYVRTVPVQYPFLVRCQCRFISTVPAPIPYVHTENPYSTRTDFVHIVPARTVPVQCPYALNSPP